jgi:L-gulonate 5-dehydrogenase
MKAIRIEEPRKISVVDLPIPIIDHEDQVMIRIAAAGICGSDVSIYKGTSPVVTYPRIMGHEMTGVVEKVGASVTHVQPGDHVIIKQTESCGTCYACTHGRENVCVNLKVRGVTIDGGYSQYTIVPEHSVFKISKDLDLLQAILIEPFTIAFHACSRGRLVSDDTLLIYGAGALGSSLIMVAHSFGCKIIAVDIDDKKLDHAKTLGADVVLNGLSDTIREEIQNASSGYGPTICIDSVCTPKSIEFLLDVVGNAGRLVTMGFDIRPSEIPQFKITAREIDIIGSRLQQGNFEQVISLFENGIIKTGGMISHIFPFTQVQEAFNVIESGKYQKIVLDFS